MNIPKGFVEYQESDLRFTGWEHECIIIDRCENHYLIPINRYKELQREEFQRTKKNAKNKKKVIPKPSEGVSGVAGCTGIGNTIISTFNIRD